MDPFSPATPADSPLTIKDVLASPLYRNLSTAKLGVGDSAYPFTLPLLDLGAGKPRETGTSVSLESFRGVKPVALIFGSYT